MGVCREQNNKQEQETQSAYQLSLHLLPLPSSSSELSFFLTGYNCGSPLIYHTEELNVDTSKYFHTQGSPGACVFSLFKMEGPIHHWLFVTETETAESICVCVCVRACVHACACVYERASVHVLMHALITRIYMCVCLYVCVICTCQMHSQDKGTE